MLARGMTRDCDDDGGIGGLLAVEETAATDSPAYWFLYDGNGNVGQVLRASDPSIAARYEYDPYGNTLVAEDWDFSGIVDDNPFRLSTKWLDTETGTGQELYCYGYRSYSPRLGRWVSGDLIDEDDTPNMYEYMPSDPIGLWDADGLCTNGSTRNTSPHILYQP